MLLYWLVEVVAVNKMTDHDPPGHPDVCQDIYMVTKHPPTNPDQFVLCECLLTIDWHNEG